MTRPPEKPQEPDASLTPPKVPDNLDAKLLAAALALRLAGSPADGSATQPPASLPAVVWVDRGDEVLVHLDSLRVKIPDRLLLVSIDLETDQTGRTPLIAAYAVGAPNDPAGLVAVTDEFPRGNGLLASRWGQVLQDAVWAGLLSVATDHARARFASPIGITAAKGTLTFHAGSLPRLKIPSPGGASR